MSLSFLPHQDKEPDVDFMRTPCGTTPKTQVDNSLIQLEITLWCQGKKLCN